MFTAKAGVGVYHIWRYGAPIRSRSPCRSCDAPSATARSYFATISSISPPALTVLSSRERRVPQPRRQEAREDLDGLGSKTVTPDRVTDHPLRLFGSADKHTVRVQAIRPNAPYLFTLQSHWTADVLPRYRPPITTHGLLNRGPTIRTEAGNFMRKRHKFRPKILQMALEIAIFTQVMTLRNSKVAIPW
jgi:hypothetical protein